jgi:predicted NUDIX family NTP pyrophosphohydrolase
VYKKVRNENFVLLAHPGGPFFKNKDAGSWTIPKGEFDDSENALNAAIREFEEETGIRLLGEFIELKPVKLKSGKMVYAWALEKDVDVSNITSNEFQIEWPPRSGRMQSFPEIDKAEWFSVEAALEKINPSQASLIEQLVKIEMK